tara:strand:- start:251 stop:1741 length:1491 start_codon:yes stop_codon:yes gene_type:complete
MSEIVRYGGAAAEEPEQVQDNCYGERERILTEMKKVSTLIMVSSPIIAHFGREYLKSSPYSGQYEIVENAFFEIFRIIDEATMSLSGRKNVCTDMRDIALHNLGLKDCKKGDKIMDGIFRAIIDFFKKNLNEHGLLAGLIGAKGVEFAGKGVVNGIKAIWTTLNNFIADVLTDLMCAIYSNGRGGLVATWVVAKSIIGTISRFVKAGGVLSYNVAVGFGGSLVRYVMLLGTWNKNRGEFQIANDTPTINTVERQTAKTDIAVQVGVVDENGNSVGLATALSDAVDNLENIEYEEDGGDELIEDYIADEQQMASDFKDNDDKVEFMRNYLLEAIEETAEGGQEYNEHHELLRMINQLAGKWRPATDMFDMGDPSELALTQDPPDVYDSDFDTDDYMDETITRANSAGIINKKDTEFIKNLNKTIKKMRNQYKSVKKSNKAGWNYVKSKKGTKKRGKRRRTTAGVKSKKGKKTTKNVGKGIHVSKSKTKRRGARRGRG